MSKQVNLVTDDFGKNLLLVRTRLVEADTELFRVMVNGRLFAPAEPVTDDVIEDPDKPHYEIVNARITDTSIRFNDNDELCVKLEIQGNGIGTMLTFHISRLNALLTALDLFEYDYLKNSYIRLKIEDNVVRDIGHIVNDVWLSEQEVI